MGRLALKCPNAVRALRSAPPRVAIAALATLATAALALAVDNPDQPAAPPAEGAPAADDSAAVQLVPIRLPLTGKDDELYRGLLQRAADQLVAQSGAAAGRPLLVVQLTVDPRADPPDGRGSDFERALSLARFLVSDQLAGVKTIAYLPRSVKGHAALVALACEEIAMAPEAELGEAGLDEPDGRAAEEGAVGFYEQIAKARRTVPTAVAIGWIDRQAEVYRVESEDRIDLVLGTELPDVEQERTIVEQDLLTPAGSLGVQTGRQGRELGFVKYLAADRAALARGLGVPPADLEPKGGLLGEWKPVVIDIDGPVTPRLVRRVETLLGDQLEARGVNWIAFRIDSSGGDLESCLRLATTIAEFNEQDVRTVAYVPVEAAGAAALVALACDQLVMQPSATIGGGELLPQAEDDPGPQRRGPRLRRPDEQGEDEEEDAAAEQEADKDEGQDDEQLEGQPNEQIAAATVTIRDSLAAKTDRTASLLVAMIDPQIVVYRYTHRETVVVKLMSDAEAAEQPDPAKWRRGDEVTSPGVTLRLSAEAAEELGVAFGVVETIDDLKQLYGLDGELPVAQSNWAQELVEALASPQLAVLLLMIAFIGVYVELNLPGVGIGGFIATVAFVLFFWSRFTVQTADWLEVMLFLTGVLCILLEVLVLPGFGVFGLGGAVLVLASLILASQTFLIPQTETQLVQLRTSLSTVALSFFSFMVVALVLRRFLPSTPFFRRMQLAPPEGADRIERDHRETVADYAHLVGMTGVATTNLMPAGKADIEGELVDVIAQGDIVDRGAKIEVVEAKANRVLVRAVRS